MKEENDQKNEMGTMKEFVEIMKGQIAVNVLKLKNDNIARTIYSTLTQHT